ncbi:MAG: T9SS type A sorting domain-containing protein [Bacteroidia bacterium]|nr:T9SS type A sorting domain-containing protein [Bacteroidia bacterium]
MPKFYFTSVFILFFSFSFSQNFPNLNASTGNTDEYPVDKDTNIYMFQGNRLSKTDKNFNVIWSNVYSGLNFTNLLLSKTGSVYFLSNTPSSSPSNNFGKINSDGSLAWIKPINGVMATIGGTVFSGGGDCKSILLTSGNNLIISGNGGFGTTTTDPKTYVLKCDTNGIPIKFNAFNMDFGRDLVIINDSSGVYKLMGYGVHLGGYVLGIYGYSDVSNSFVSYESLVGFGCCSGCSFVPTAYWQFYRSKMNSKSFYLFATASNSIGATYRGVIKATDNANVSWIAPVHTSSIFPVSPFGRMEEDNSGNVFASIGSIFSNFTSAFMRIDSNGVGDPYLTKMLSGYNNVPSYQIPNHSPRVIHDNNYYFDIWGYSFPANPITVQRYDSSLVLPCGSTLSSSVSNCVYAANAGWPITATIVPVSSFTLGTVNVTVTPSAFSVNQNFCTVVGLENSSTDRNGIEIYPNPANDKLYISDKNYAVNSIEVYDVNGKNIKSVDKDSSIDIRNLNTGIYFIRIKTDRGNFNKKFIKE